MDTTHVYARAPRGRRLMDHVRCNYGRIVSLIVALRLSSVNAPFAIEGAVNTAVFETNTQHILAPTIQPGDIVVMDDLNFHQSPAAHQHIEARGASILFLPAYSPALSRTDQAFAKLMSFLVSCEASRRSPSTRLVYPYPHQRLGLPRQLRLFQSRLMAHSLRNAL